MKRKFEFDEEIAECPLCNEFLSSPIHQCKNGHVACAACCEKLKKKECPTCRAKPFAQSRSLALEKIIESLRSACVHAPYGCTEVVKLGKDQHAEEACDYRQFKCPVPACSYTGPKREVPEHFTSVHSASIAHFAQGLRSTSFNILWRPALRYILFVLDKELFLVHIHYVSKGLLPMGEVEYQLPIIMLCCSSFGNDSLKYNIAFTVKSEDGVSSSSKVGNALAFNNQMTGDIWESEHLILLPNVTPSPEDVITLQLTLL